MPVHKVYTDYSIENGDFANFFGIKERGGLFPTLQRVHRVSRGASPQYSADSRHLQEAG